tara:strand:+ start:101503 stop:101817 length:315 start_codon:yes stop_codon:yes gene_type:complete
MENAKSEKAYIEKYQNLGYTANYRVIDSHLIDLQTKKKYAPKEVYIEEEFRFEGMSNPADMSILYIVHTKDKSKGTVLANYSPASDTALAEFFAAIPKENYKAK